jgi:trehalose-6-phosphatase
VIGHRGKQLFNWLKCRMVCSFTNAAQVQNHTEQNPNRQNFSDDTIDFHDFHSSKENESGTAKAFYMETQSRFEPLVSQRFLLDPNQIPVPRLITLVCKRCTQMALLSDYYQD